MNHEHKASQKTPGNWTSGPHPGVATLTPIPPSPPLAWEPQNRPQEATLMIATMEQEGPAPSCTAM